MIYVGRANVFGRATPRPALGPTIQWLPGNFRWQSGLSVTLSTHPDVMPNLKEEYSYVSLPPLCFYWAGYRMNVTLFCDL